MPLPSPLSYISAVTRADCWVILTPYGWLLATHRKQQLSTLQTTFIIGKAFITTLRHPSYWIRTMEGLWQERSSSLCVVQLLTLPKLTFDLKSVENYMFLTPPLLKGEISSLYFFLLWTLPLVGTFCISRWTLHSPQSMFSCLFNWADDHTCDWSEGRVAKIHFWNISRTSYCTCTHRHLAELPYILEVLTVQILSYMIGERKNVCSDPPVE